MTDYNPEKLEEDKEALLACYANRLREMKETGKIPESITVYADIFEHAIPYFSKDDQKQLTKLHTLGQQQYHLVKARTDIQWFTGHKSLRLLSAFEQVKKYAPNEASRFDEIYGIIDSLEKRLEVSDSL